MVKVASRCYSERSISGGLNPAEFAQKIRQLAMDAHRGLTRPDTSVDELLSLKQRFEDLRGETQEPQAAQIDRWLGGGVRIIVARIHSELAKRFRVRLDRHDVLTQRSTPHVARSAVGRPGCRPQVNRAQS
jgi:hypothetical protein